MQFTLTGGQVADVTQAIPLMQGVRTRLLLNDKGSDAEALLDRLAAFDTAPVIPRKANQKVKRSCDGCVCQEHQASECIFGELKYYRRIASRFKKKASHFKEIWALATVLS